MIVRSHLYECTWVGLSENIASILHEAVDVRCLLPPAVNRLRQTVALALLLVLEVRQKELSLDLHLVDEAVTVLVDDRSPLVNTSLTTQLTHWHIYSVGPFAGTIP